MNDEIEQPDIKSGTQPGTKRLHKGSERSQAKLAELGFDPIERLVQDYEKLNEMIAWEEECRDGIRIRMNSRGQQMTWYPDAMMKMLDQRQKIGADLLRYKYGRVSETTNVNVKTPKPFVVQTTAKGEIYHSIGNSMSDDENADLDDD